METGVLELKDNLSAILRDVESGKTDCVVVKRYGKPVAQIVPYVPGKPDATRRIGYYDDVTAVNDWATFDEMDDEVAKLFGAE